MDKEVIAQVIKGCIYTYLQSANWYSEFPHRLEKLCDDGARKIMKQTPTNKRGAG